MPPPALEPLEPVFPPSPRGDERLMAPPPPALDGGPPTTGGDEPHWTESAITQNATRAITLPVAELFIGASILKKNRVKPEVCPSPSCKRSLPSPIATFSLNSNKKNAVRRRLSLLASLSLVFYSTWDSMQGVHCARIRWVSSPEYLAWAWPDRRGNVAEAIPRSRLRRPQVEGQTNTLPIR